MTMILHFVTFLCLVHSCKSQGLFDFFGFGTGTGVGNADLFGPAQAYDPWFSGGGGGGTNLGANTWGAGGTGGGGGFGQGFGGTAGGTGFSSDARLTMAEEQMAEVMGESPRNSPERQRIDRLIKVTGGRFTGDAAPLNYLVTEYMMTTPGPAIPQQPAPKGTGKQRAGKRRQRQGKLQNRNRQGNRQNNGGNGHNMNGKGQAGAGMQQQKPYPTAPAGKIGTRQQRPRQRAQNMNQQYQDSIYQAQPSANNQIYQPAPPSNNQMYQPTPSSNNQIYQAPPPLSNQMYQGPPPSNNQMYQGPPPSNNQMNQALPPSNSQIYKGLPPSKNQMYQGPPPSNNQMYQGPPPSNNQMNQGLPPSNSQIYKGPPLSKNQMYQDQSQNYQAQNPPNQSQKPVYRSPTTSNQAPGQAYQQAPQWNNNQGNGNGNGNRNGQNNGMNTKSVTKARKSNGPIAVNRLKRIEGRIADVNSQLSQAQQYNNMAQVKELQSQLDALNGVKNILTGGSAKTNKMETIRGRPMAKSQEASKQPQPQQNQRPYGPPKLNRNNGPPLNNNGATNYNNFQEASVGGQLVQTWEHATQTMPGRNKRQPTANVDITPYQNTAPSAEPFATTFAQYQPSAQPTPAYDLGLNQQQQFYDPNLPPYDHGFNQQGAAANNAPPKRAQRRRKGRRGGANRAPTPPTPTQPAVSTVPPKLGDTKWIGNAEYVYYDADGFDTFQWVKKSSIPAGQLDHVPQNQEGQQAGQGQQEAAPPA